MLRHAHEQVLCRHWIATAFAQGRLFLFTAKLTLSPNPHPAFRMAHLRTKHGKVHSHGEACSVLFARSELLQTLSVDQWTLHYLIEVALMNAAEVELTLTPF